MADPVVLMDHRCVHEPTPGFTHRGCDERAERRLVLAAQTGGAPERAALVEGYLPLIGSVARLYRESRVVERAELMQEGVVGLLRALQRYDPELGTPFWAYASWWVRQAMQKLVAELTRPVVLSDRALRQLSRIKEVHRAHLRSHSAEPTVDDLAQGSGLTVDQVEHLTAADREPRGLQEPMRGQDGGATLGDLLADPPAEDAFDEVAEHIWLEQLRRSRAHAPRARGAAGDQRRAGAPDREGRAGPHARGPHRVTPPRRSNIALFTIGSSGKSFMYLR
jgi:RNA polymerase sigma factor (sigma-70 family)